MAVPEGHVEAHCQQASRQHWVPGTLVSLFQLLMCNVYPLSLPSVAAITSSLPFFSPDCFPFLLVFLVSFGAGLLEVGQVSGIVGSELGKTNYNIYKFY